MKNNNDHVFTEFEIYTKDGVEQVYCVTECNGYRLEIEVPLDYLNYCPICGKPLSVK